MPDEDVPPDSPTTGADDEDDWNRPRGLYTPTDRKFLTGAKTYEDSPVSRSNRRGAIRERARNGLLDLRYLPAIEPDQREKIFEELEEQSSPGELRHALASFVEFLYLGLDDPRPTLETVVSSGVMNALLADKDESQYGVPTTQTTIDVSETYDLNDLEKRLDKNPEYLTPEEIGVLVRSGRVSPEDVDDLQTDRESDPSR